MKIPLIARHVATVVTVIALMAISWRGVHAQESAATYETLTGTWAVTIITPESGMSRVPSSGQLL